MSARVGAALLALLVGCAAGSGGSAGTADGPAPRPCRPERGGVAGPRAVAAGIDDVAWIAGDHASVDGAFEELWTRPRGGMMAGIGRSLDGDRVAFVEVLCLVERGGTLVYEAMPGVGAAVPFTLTALTADRALFENPAHDFPRAIEYRRDPDGIQTAIGAAPDALEPVATLRRR